MKKLRLSLALFSALSGFAYAQVNTAPVGFFTVQVPAGNVANPSFSTISFPLSNAVEAAGAIASIDSSNQLTVAGAAWTAGGFVSASAPRLVKVTSGNHVGRFFLITANTSNQVTVDLSSSAVVTDLTTALSVGDTVQIVPAYTLGALFGTSSTSLVTGSSVSNADNIWILSGQTWNTYYHNGTNWRRTGSLANQNNTVIYPDEGVLLVHIGGSPLSLTFTGTVPVVNEKTDINGSGTTFLANRFPVDVQLNSIGLQSLTGWVTGSNAAAADNVWIWNPAKTPAPGWDTYYHNGTNWRRSGSLANQNTTLIPGGTAMIVIKLGTGAHATLAQTLPYTP